MSDAPDTTQETNSQTTTDQSAPKVDAPAPDSSDTNSSTTTEADAPKDESILGDAQTDGPNDVDSPDTNDAEPNALLGAPEGDYELTLPEGVEMDAAALTAIAPVAKEIGLSNEGLSKLAGVYGETILPSVVASVSQQINDQAAQLRTDWATDTRAMIEGGKNAAGEDVTADTAFDGKRLPQVQQVAAKALDRFGGEGFREWLTGNGLANDPRMVKFAYLAGKAISEDTSFERSDGPAERPKTREQKFYGENAA